MNLLKYKKLAEDLEAYFKKMSAQRWEDIKAKCASSLRAEIDAERKSRPNDDFNDVAIDVLLHRVVELEAVRWVIEDIQKKL